MWGTHESPAERTRCQRNTYAQTGDIPLNSQAPPARQEVRGVDQTCCLETDRFGIGPASNCKGFPTPSEWIFICLKPPTSPWSSLPGYSLPSPLPIETSLSRPLFLGKLSPQCHFSKALYPDAALVPRHPDPPLRTTLRLTYSLPVSQNARR